MISPREKAFLHIYPDLAHMSDQDRRDVLTHAAGVDSSSNPGMSHDGVDRAMAAYEAILWARVDRRVVPDPRACAVCGRPLRHAGGGVGECPEGCGSRKVHAWSRDYWRKRLPAGHGANSRQIWKLKELWSLLRDYLPESDRTDAYLAGIISNSVAGDFEQLLESGNSLAWHRLTANQTNVAIEAIKDRLRYAVRQVDR
jgi:hypothetical protein